MTTPNYSFWCFVGCLPEAIWDLIQLGTWMFKSAPKRRKGARSMSFRESHPRLFFLGIALNAILIFALPLGFYLALHHPAINAAGSAPTGTNPTPPAPATVPPAHTSPPTPVGQKQPHLAKPHKQTASSTPPTQTTETPLNPTPGTTYEQHCKGSACAQGPGSQATYNQYGALKLMMTDTQESAVCEAMTRFNGTQISVDAES